MITTVAIKTQQGKYPAGTVGGNWSISVLNPTTRSVVDSYIGPNSFAAFELPEGHAFVAYGQRLDFGNNPLGPQVFAEFTVDSRFAFIEVAESVSVTTPMPK